MFKRRESKRSLQNEIDELKESLRVALDKCVDREERLSNLLEDFEKLSCQNSVLKMELYSEKEKRLQNHVENYKDPSNFFEKEYKKIIDKEYNQLTEEHSNLINENKTLTLERDNLEERVSKLLSDYAKLSDEKKVLKLELLSQKENLEVKKILSNEISMIWEVDNAKENGYKELCPYPLKDPETEKCFYWLGKKKAPNQGG